MQLNYQKIKESIQNSKMYWPGYIIGSLGVVLGIFYLLFNDLRYDLESSYSSGPLVILAIIPIFIVVGYLLNKKSSLENELRTLNNRLIEQNQELKKSHAKLKEADHLKSNFLMIMSHELRTPLNAVLVFSSLLKNGVYGKINNHQEKSLELILNSGHRLLSLIEDLLDLSKIEAGEIGLLLSEFTLDELLVETIDNLKEFAEKKNLKLQVESDNIPRIYGDKNKVKYILMSLIENAIKFTDEGEILIKSKLNSNSFYIIVKDTGIGIKEEDYNRIYDEFIQLDNSSTREYGGIGLGLTISKKFIELHGGKITVKSVLGTGTKFEVELPIRHA